MNDAFNYVAVLVSIIIGLAATRLLSGMSEMLQAANRPRIYWIHVMWLLTLFMEVLLFWWMLYRWHYTANWTFFLFVWVTHPSILLYLASAVLFPGELETSGSSSWRDYYYKNRRSFFLIFGAIAPLDIVDTLLKGKQHFLDQGVLYLPFIAIWGFGCLAAAITPSPRYHAIWAITLPVVMIAYTAIVLLQLG
jgi:hypothetical protein